MNDEEYMEAYNHGHRECQKHERMSHETRLEFERVKHAIWFFIGAVSALLIDSIIHALV